VTFAAIDGGEAAIAITDRAGRLVCANGLYDRWFGPTGNLYYPLDRETAQRLASSAYWLR